MDKLSYALGLSMANNFLGSGIQELNIEDFADGLRAVYEGVAFSHRTHIDKLLTTRERPAAIRMAGGAANSPVWVQMFADALQMPISVVSGEEMGVKGVAITASVAAGMYESIEDAVAAMVHPGTLVQPNPELAEVYAAKLETFRTLVDTLAPVWELM